MVLVDEAPAGQQEQRRGWLPGRAPLPPGPTAGQDLQEVSEEGRGGSLARGGGRKLLDPIKVCVLMMCVMASRYLDSVRPLLTEDEYKVTKSVSVVEVDAIV